MKISTVQIHSDEMYAFEPLLHETIHSYRAEIANLRKFIKSPDTDSLSDLSKIQNLEGRICILADILEQLELE